MMTEPTEDERGERHDPEYVDTGDEDSTLTDDDTNRADSSDDGDSTDDGDSENGDDSPVAP